VTRLHQSINLLMCNVVSERLVNIVHVSLCLFSIEYFDSPHEVSVHLITMPPDSNNEAPTALIVRYIYMYDCTGSHSDFRSQTTPRRGADHQLG
jgi:hypothetical protein